MVGDTIQTRKSVSLFDQFFWSNWLSFHKVVHKFKQISESANAKRENCEQSAKREREKQRHGTMEFLSNNWLLLLFATRVEQYGR